MRNFSSSWTPRGSGELVTTAVLEEERGALVESTGGVIRDTCALWRDKGRRWRSMQPFLLPPLLFIFCRTRARSGIHTRRSPCRCSHRSFLLKLPREARITRTRRNLTRAGELRTSVLIRVLARSRSALSSDACSRFKPLQLHARSKLQDAKSFGPSPERTTPAENKSMCSKGRRFHCSQTFAVFCEGNHCSYYNLLGVTEFNLLKTKPESFVLIRWRRPFLQICF